MHCTVFPFRAKHRRNDRPALLQITCQYLQVKYVSPRLRFLLRQLIADITFAKLRHLAGLPALKFIRSLFIRQPILSTDNGAQPRRRFYILH